MSSSHDLSYPVGKAHVLPIFDRVSRLPWWAIVAALLGVLFAWIMAVDKDYQTVFGAISDGVRTTIYVTLVSYAIAIVMALIVALGRVSERVAIQQVSTFYVEIVRGVPTLVLLLYVAFV